MKRAKKLLKTITTLAMVATLCFSEGHYVYAVDETYNTEEAESIMSEQGTNEEEMKVEEATNTDIVVQTEDDSSVFAQNSHREDKKKPCTITEYVEWKGGMLNIPVDLGDYSVQEISVDIEKDGSRWGMKYENGNVVANIVNYIIIKGDEWYTKAGCHDVKITFYKNGEILTKSNVTVNVLENSTKWQVKEEKYEFDGSQDVTFSLKNGTNCFEIQSVKELGIYTGMGSVGGPSVSVPNMTEGFTWDKEAGTLKINKDALKKTLASATSHNGGVLPDEIAINVHAVAMDGQNIYNINQIPYSMEHGFLQTITAWWLNISKLNHLPEKTIDAVTDLKAVFYGKNRVRLTWEKSKEAEGYLIYTQKNGKYGYCGMTTKGTTFTDTKALDTDYNFYWVFPYMTDSTTGKMIPGPCEKYVYAKGVLPAVQNLKASSVKGGVRLTWSKQPEAVGYLVYGQNGENFKYHYIGMTTKGTTFTDKKASKKDYNFYWVYPYHENAAGKKIVGGTAPYTYGRAR